MDMIEDGLEFHGCPIDYVGEVPISRRPNREAMHRCPQCGCYFHSDKNWASHIHREHGLGDAYVLVNGAILGDSLFLENAIDSFQIVVVGPTTAEVKIAVDGAEHRVEVSQGLKEIPWLGKVRSGEARVIISISGRRPYEHHIYVKELPRFRGSEADDLFLKLHAELGGQDDEGLVFRCWELNSEAYQASRLERMYVNGLFEYTFGAAFETAGMFDRAGPRFEEAYSLLRCYRTPLALTALCVLSLKLNCFGHLALCSESSFFQPANVFFNHFPETRRLRAIAGGSVGLFVDPHTEDLVNALRCFVSSDLQRARNLLGKLRAHPEASRLNNRIKLDVLEARLAARLGDSQRARSNYDYLKDHPRFRDEAEEYLETHAEPA